MMLKFFYLLGSLLLCRIAYTQDIIVKNDKTEIKSKVLEITEEVIKYKKFEMLDGPTYAINKSDVFMLLYANGTKEYMENKTSATSINRSTETANNTENGEMEPGIYYFNPLDGQYTEIDGSNISNTKQGGFGEALLRNTVSGLFNAKERAMLGGSHASIEIKSDTPAFLFVIDVAQKGFNNSSTYLGKVSSPSDFILVKLRQQQDNRELVIGRSNDYGSTQGIDEKQKIPFRYIKIKKGYYKVVTNSKLEQGEYCFMFASASLYEGVARKVFDFSVQYEATGKKQLP